MKYVTVSPPFFHSDWVYWCERGGESQRIENPPSVSPQPSVSWTVFRLFLGGNHLCPPVHSMETWETGKVGDFYKGPLLHNTIVFNLYNVPYVNMWTIKDENFIIKHTFVNFIKLAYWQSGTQIFHFLTLKSALRHHETDNKFENI